MNSSLLRLVLACASVLPMWAHAGVQVGTTRVVYPVGAREVPVQLNNTGTTASLIQAWVDAGDPRSRPDNIEGVPFVVTPPISRIDANQGQVLSLRHLGQDAPTDRESLYWINILDIPATPKTAEPAEVEKGVQGSLQFAVRSRLKIFLRPKALAGSTGTAAAGKAVEQLSWRVATQAGKPGVVASNPTPYFVSVAYLVVPNQGRVEASTVVPPFGKVHIPLNAPMAPTAEFVVRTINDYGGPVDTPAIAGQAEASAQP